MKLKGTIDRELASGGGVDGKTADADVVTWRIEVSGLPPLEQRVRLRANKGARVLERTLHRPMADPALVESVQFAEHFFEDGVVVAMMTTKVVPGILIATPDAEQVAREAAVRIARTLRDAIEARQRATIALSGGNTPRTAYGLLARDSSVDWSKVEVFWVDERAVAPTDDRSNFFHAKEMLLDPAQIPAGARASDAGRRRRPRRGGAGVRGAAPGAREDADAAGSPVVRPDGARGSGTTGTRRRSFRATRRWRSPTGSSWPWRRRGSAKRA